ncbi:MAG TPA: polyhydroxyalkanoate depolymerase [Rhizomicrobium sp.]|jgi:polyhydroxyalkanoate depolymerase|nr:polyhydroxyalkanoate depolymerase [Rhizomicrobium sp.]
MLYDAYQARQDLLSPLRIFADLTAAAFREPMGGPWANLLARSIGGGAELISRLRLTHEHPAYNIGTIVVAGREVAISEEPALKTPFGTLLHFRKSVSLKQPRVLLVAPMAGHFSTLLRDTVRTLLADHDVFITDWNNARDIPRSAGNFGLDDYVGHMMRFIEYLGPNTHVIGVCQPCNALMCAVALLAQNNSAALPPSLTLMAGPVDTRINPTQVNELADEHPIQWFEKNLISTVPARYKGAHRRVYPGFLQLSSFMAMNMPRHVRAHLDLYEHVVAAEDAKAETTRTFYDEYFAVFDLPAEFYLETVQRVFQEHHLARGIFEWRGQKVDPSKIRKTALLTVEGERDDICAPGQTVAAHDLTPGIRSNRKHHYLQPGVGHYGVFSGKHWQREIYPVVRDFIAKA